MHKSKEDLIAHLEAIEDYIDTAKGELQYLVKQGPNYYYEELSHSLDLAHAHAKAALGLDNDNPDLLPTT